jgi:hypothetical protein
MLLIAGCPILEYLKLSEMDLDSKEDSLILQEFKTLSLPKLTRADIVQFYCPCFPVNALSTSKYLSIHTSKVVEHLTAEDHRAYKVRLLANMMHATSIKYNTLMENKRKM